MKRREIVIEQDNRAGQVTYWLARGPQSLAGRNGVSLAAYIHALYFFLRAARARKILLIGCGGGTLATMLARAAPRPQITMLDVDAMSFELARRYFHLPDSVACHVMDGAKFLRAATGRYDAIVLDAFGEDGVPRHLLRESFFAAVKAHLSRDGLFLVNLLAADDEDRRPDKIGFRLNRIFSQVRLCDAEAELDRNVLLLAGRVKTLKRPRLLLRPTRGADALSAELKGYDFRHLTA
jgi:spermidine synthase